MKLSGTIYRKTFSVRNYGNINNGLHRFPANFKAAPFKLPSETPCHKRTLGDYDVCLKSDDTVHKFGIPEDWIQRFLKNDFKIRKRGLSLFRVVNEDLQMALHSFVNDKNKYFKCKVIDSDSVVQNIAFECNRDLGNDKRNPLGQHYLAIPTADFELNKLNDIAQAQSPERSWFDCPFYPPNQPGGPPISSEDLPGGGDPDNRLKTYDGKKVFHIPEPEGDAMNIVAHVVLRRLAQDVSQDVHDRLWAMIFLFECVDFQLQDDLPSHPSAPHIVSLLLRKALALGMDGEGRLITDQLEHYELLCIVDFWLKAAEGRPGLTNLEVEMEAVLPGIM